MFAVKASSHLGPAMRGHPGTVTVRLATLQLKVVKKNLLKAQC